MSPERKNCAKIVKDAEDVIPIYMGPTTLDKSERMRKCCYDSKVTSEYLQPRFARGGEIPQFLFNSAGNLSRGISSDAALAAIDDRLAFALDHQVEKPKRIDAGIVATQFKSLWSLYHLLPDSYFTSYTIELCSGSGRKLLLDRLLEKEVHDPWNLFYETDQKHGTLRGIRFEAYAHKKMVIDGIDVTARRELIGFKIQSRHLCLNSRMASQAFINDVSMKSNTSK
jgi:hypothetical protein